MDIEAFKRGGKVKRKKVLKQKQKQTQNVKQSVIVKIDSDALKRKPSRPRQPRVKQTPVSISYTPTLHDQTAYTELRTELKKLQKEKEKKIKAEEKLITDANENKEINKVRQKQQEDYQQALYERSSPIMQPQPVPIKPLKRQPLEPVGQQVYEKAIPKTQESPYKGSARGSAHISQGAYSGTRSKVKQQSLYEYMLQSEGGGAGEEIPSSGY